MQADIIDKFTTHVKNVLTRALCLVLETGAKNVEPIHLFWALSTEKGSIGAEILLKSELKQDDVNALFADRAAKLPLDFGKKVKKKSVESVTPKLSDGSKRAIEKSVLAANIYEHKYVGTEHILSGLLQIDDKAITKFLADNGIDAKRIREQVTAVLKSTSKFPELAASLGMHHESELTGARGRIKKQKKSKPKTPALDFFGTDLTGREVQKKIDPVIGRETELERIMQILCRRVKNNPILLGDPGVGKTALVEGLAQKIASGEAPEALQGRRILALDLSLIIAGTMYRGEFEGRLKQIIDEVKASPEIILFIDEVHTIIGAGSASGSLDAANILKPALSRGEIRCIGATTLAEYKKHIESDSALERRFAPVILEEPTPDATVKILDGLKKSYEDFHGVAITREAIVRAVELADRYLQEKFFPDKAIDLIDEAASGIKVKRKSGSFDKKLRELREMLNGLVESKREAVANEKFVEAISLKEEERALEEEIAGLEKRISSKKQPHRGKLLPRHVSEVISRMTGIPLETLMEDERARLADLEAMLGSSIRGQEQVIAEVARYLRRAKTGISHPSRPLASFLFVGPSGVGKTELAKLIAEKVYQDKGALIRLDMSEFSEGFSISKLIGSPAGYVGYRDHAKLTDSVKRRPYSVVLFDELEKAHHDVLNVLLQILDDGRLTDATGRTVNFKNTVIIMTSNIGSERLIEKHIGFGASAAEFRELGADFQNSLRERFRPEFLNRIDRVCVFQPLGEECLSEICDLQIKELNGRLGEHKVQIEIDSGVRDWIVGQGMSPEHGARAVRRVIQDHIEGQVARFLIDGPPKKTETVKFKIKDGLPVLCRRQ